MIVVPLGEEGEWRSPIHSLSFYLPLPLKEKVQFSLSLFLARSAEEEETEDGEDAQKAFYYGSSPGHLPIHHHHNQIPVNSNFFSVSLVHVSHILFFHFKILQHRQLIN